MAEVLRLAQRVIDLADGDPTKGNLIFGSPLAFAIAFRGAARWCLGIPGWKDDFDQGRRHGACGRPRLPGRCDLLHVRCSRFPNGVLLPDATALRDTADALAIAERSGDELALSLARFARGIALVHRDGPRA